MINKNNLISKNTKLALTLCSLIGTSMLSLSIGQAKASDVIGIADQHLQVSYWQQQATPKQLLSAAQINQFNQSMLANNPHVVDVFSVPDQLNAEQLKNYVKHVSSVPKWDRFYVDGRKLGAKDYAHYLKNINLDAIKASNPVRWALVVKRTSLRTFPTMDKVLNSGMDADLDRFQETGVFPVDALAVVHESADGQWYLVQSYNYLAWVQKKDIALGEKQEVLDYALQTQSAAPLVITGDKVFTSYVPEHADISEVQLDMGVKLPLVKHKDTLTQVYGQNPYASHVVILPTKNEQGELAFKHALIAYNQDTRIGYLPFTEQNLINQGFKFLGERYGWGHSYNSRDCTGFVGEIYKTFGLLMPRNSAQQGKGVYGENINFDKNTSKEEKIAAIQQLKIGDLIYIPGHVMMYLGEDNGKPYVIHDVKGLGYINGDNQLYKGTLNGVSVTPLLDLMLSENRSYVDRIYNMKRIR